MTASNPFEPPSEVADVGVAPPVGRLHTLRLYSAKQVALATFLGTPIASGWLMAANYTAFGDPRNARKAIILGVVTSAFLVTIAFLLPDAVARVVGLACIFAAHYIAKASQGRAYVSVLAAGGTRFSTWRVVGISLACILVFFAVSFAIGLAIGAFVPEALEE